MGILACLLISSPKSSIAIEDNKSPETWVSTNFETCVSAGLIYDKLTQYPDFAFRVVSINKEYNYIIVVFIYTSERLGKLSLVARQTENNIVCIMGEGNVPLDYKI